MRGGLVPPSAHFQSALKLTLAPHQPHWNLRRHCNAMTAKAGAQHQINKTANADVGCSLVHSMARRTSWFGDAIFRAGIGGPLNRRNKAPACHDGLSSGEGGAGADAAPPLACTKHFLGGLSQLQEQRKSKANVLRISCILRSVAAHLPVLH